MRIALTTTIAALGLMLASCGNADQQEQAGGTGVVSSEFKQVIDARHASFKEIGKVSKAVQDELKKGSPSVETIRQNAARMQQLSTELNTWFPTGSGAETGLKTAALAVIWEQSAAFAEAGVKFQNAAAALDKAAVAGDLAGIRKAAAEVGPTCKGCHDQFRLED